MLWHGAEKMTALAEQLAIQGQKGGFWAEKSHLFSDLTFITQCNYETVALNIGKEEAWNTFLRKNQLFN